MSNSNRCAVIALLAAGSWLNAQTTPPKSTPLGNATTSQKSVTGGLGNSSVTSSGGVVTAGGIMATSSAGTTFSLSKDASRTPAKTAQQLADTDWHFLEVLMTAAPIRPTPGNPAAERLHHAALEAKEFYTNYPKDPRVALAKKYEVMAEVQAAYLGGSAYQSKASALSNAYRGDQRIAASDRFEVALAAENLALAPTLAAKSVADRGAAQEGVADRLAVEFGDDASVYANYVSVMRSSDAATAQRVAGKLVSKNSPAAAKSEATKFVAAQLTNLGKGVTLNLKKSTGTVLSLTAGSGQPTVLYFWSKETMERDLGALRAVKDTLPAGAKWIYIGLGVSAAEADLTGKVPFGGEFCAEPQAFASSTAEQFNIVQTPYVSVLDSKGKLSGSGRVPQLPSLLSGVK